jgi:hypothetical protein
MYLSASMSAAGTLTFSNGNFTPNASLLISLETAITNDCMSALMGEDTVLDATLCANYGEGMAQSLGSASCTFDGTDCNCTQTVSGGSAEADTYTVSGSTLTWSDGSTSEFCVASNTMTQRSPLGDAGYAVMTLTKQ